VDYHQVNIPGGTPPEDYHWTERRAEILDLILERGTPYGIKQVRLAERYEVSEGQISQDMDRLREYVDKTLGQHAKLTTRAVFENAVEEAREQGNWREAFDLAMEWNEWLQSIGAQEQAPDRHEVQAEVDATQEQRKLMVGVDLTSFPDVAEERMVGVDMRQAEAQEEVAGADPASIDVAEPGSQADTGTRNAGESEDQGNE